MNNMRHETWANDMVVIHGRYEYDNGDMYMGKHANGYKHGYGVLDYSNGDKFKGMFHNDLPKDG